MAFLFVSSITKAVPKDNKIANAYRTRVSGIGRTRESKKSGQSNLCRR
jgi:hypothetical protein